VIETNRLRLMPLSYQQMLKYIKNDHSLEAELMLNHSSVADVCFQGEPNEIGEIEIGYGTYKQHQGKGYMTEAVKV